MDSTGWIEYFRKGPKAARYDRYVTAPLETILTPTIVLLEVYRKIKKDKGEEKALEAHAHLEGTRTVPLRSDIALAAADFGLKTGLGTVDSIIYATARRYDADLITSDHHFQGLPGVTMI
ncbi:MAG TPA: type II toxin-antitoxin system VapC family toxin [Candidatus Dormibacteraeota bacterium]|nr:type II toxin-antitoxin system VapC family toxin [Candidatus Dormibacteraeota bacterium]